MGGDLENPGNGDRKHAWSTEHLLALALAAFVVVALLLVFFGWSPR
jgi:hypothetical protein